MQTPVPAYMARLRNQMRDAEMKSDQSLLAKVELLRGMLHARLTEDLPAPHTGQQAVIRVARAIQSEISSANDLFRVHDQLTGVRQSIVGVLPEEDTPMAPSGELDEPAAAAA